MINFAEIFKITTPFKS